MYTTTWDSNDGTMVITRRLLHHQTGHSPLGRNLAWLEEVAAKSGRTVFSTQEGGRPNAMPGNRLNDVERRLLERWSLGTGYDFPLLESISVAGQHGLRGITELSLRFDYPVTAIAGRNGCGKSTILALAALAFHSPDGYHPPNALGGRRGSSTCTYYTFSNFFYRGPGDAPVTGLNIRWTYRGTQPVALQKRTEKWMHYDRRPKRPVHFVGMMRAVPAFEYPALRGHFKPSARPKRRLLSPEYLSCLGGIMGRTYERASVLTASKYSVRTVRSSSEYSSFNMGSGEDLLVDLLWVLQEAWPGSLIVVEEVELGLHPEAVSRLAEVLQEVALQKGLQIIVSTHSRYFIDSVPVQARILLQRFGGHHEVTYQPTTQYAMGEMSGVCDPELFIYCEDVFARRLIEASIPTNVRRRCRVIPVGSKSELCDQVRFHHLVEEQAKYLVVWDGDVGSQEIASWWSRSGIDDLSWTRLPGNKPPERWAVEALNNPEGYRVLAEEMGETVQRAHGLMLTLLACPDYHDIPHKLASEMAVSNEEAVGLLVRSVRRLPNQPLAELRMCIESALAGRTVGERLSAVG